jgi:hypothetical protein
LAGQNSSENGAPDAKLLAQENAFQDYRKAPGNGN